MTLDNSFRQFYSDFIQRLVNIRTEDDTDSFCNEYSLDGVSHKDTLPVSLYLSEHPPRDIPEKPSDWPFTGPRLQDYLKGEIDKFAILYLFIYDRKMLETMLTFSP